MQWVTCCRKLIKKKGENSRTDWYNAQVQMGQKEKSAVKKEMLIEKETILSLEFYNYKGIFTGSLKQMRYRICKIEEEEKKFFEVSVWGGPYNYDVTPEEEMEVQKFDVGRRC